VSAQLVTLLAALIAAAASICSLLVNVLAAGRRERRETHRKAVEPELPDLADGLHQVVATSFTQHRQLGLGKTESATSWRQRGRDAAQLLGRVRPRVRYSLPGADLGLRNLARLPDWIAHYGGRPEGQTLLDQADVLATGLHELIEQSWRRGAPPLAVQRRKIQTLADNFRQCAPFEVRQQAIVEEPEE
jgi:hypothetical protein